MDDDNANNPDAPLLSENRTSPRSWSQSRTLLGGEGAHAGAKAATEDLIPNGSGTWFIWALTLSAGLSGLLFGYDTGVISSTLVCIKTDLSHRELTTLDKSLITSSTSLFALISSPIAGALGDRLGRKPVILIADALFVVGALWQAATSDVSGMIVGRSLVGLAVGAASLITPLYVKMRSSAGEQRLDFSFLLVQAVAEECSTSTTLLNGVLIRSCTSKSRYIAELSPSEIRGRLVTVLALFITGGQVTAYVTGWLLSTAPSGWRWMVGLGALPALIQLFILIFLPETPRWLVKAGKDNEARLVLGKVYGKSDIIRQAVDRIIRDIENDINEEIQRLAPQQDATSEASQCLNSMLQSWSSLFRIPSNRRALIIACMLQGFQQLCGFNSLMYFSATIFNLLSFSSPTLTSLSVAVTNFIFTLLAFSLIDRIGRRRILLSSIPIMALSLLFCAAVFPSMDIFPTPGKGVAAGVDSNDYAAAPQSGLKPVLILISLTMYTASYASGLGNVPWQQSELFPLQVRSLGSALATATNWGSNFLVGLTFLPLMEFISPGWTFLIYAVVCIVGWLAVWAIYPEMSGLGLEDVKSLLVDGWGVSESLERFVKRRGNVVQT
ncbi:Sugar transporter family protein [Coccidioides posadasii C735 delta SOWgp]|uniref:Sugar transporter family protein n=1 Tax=Coccidioides posadasii (strain C735) TaxID=222929 RepID=C5P8I3_COCP7|nr:Sugar transporter family protein [Coccidioides posadasii C735 delta SOWgp]EER26045.1 Sugar transporter family protein [Coccidioides posadasii C735 delta SOWgp]|eukprot:XP_003068190.1 Sugar transporter family protein [Coccidioides posadasii C735 delta SOWgp]